MEKQGEAQSQVYLIDNPHAPEVFAAEALGFFVHAGNIHITFATPRASHTANPSPINRVVIGRLVMPVQGAQSLAIGLYDFLKKQGFDPAPKPEGQQIQ